jgi:hypothetical protein
VDECVLPSRQGQDVKEKPLRATRRGTSTTRSHLKVLVASWNVGNAMPPKSATLISKWIPEGGGDLDVIAIGLQESSYREKTGSVGDFTPSDRKSTASSAKSDGSDSDNVADASDGEGDEEEGTEVQDDAQRSSSRASVSAVSGPTKKSSVVPNNQLPVATQDGGDKVEATPSETEVIVKRSRAKKSMRKVSSMVKQLSSNIRDTVGDALEYPFIRQLLHHVGESYELVGKVELMEMRLFVLVHVRNSVSDTDKIAVPTGLGSVIGNKVRPTGARFERASCWV